MVVTILLLRCGNEYETNLSYKYGFQNAPLKYYIFTNMNVFDQILFYDINKFVHCCVRESLCGNFAFKNRGELIREKRFPRIDLITLSFFSIL